MSDIGLLTEREHYLLKKIRKRIGEFAYGTSVAVKDGLCGCSVYMNAYEWLMTPHRREWECENS